MDYNTDIQFLVLSSAAPGGGLLRADCVVPLEPAAPAAVPVPDGLLGKWRVYLAAASLVPFALDPAMGGWVSRAYSSV